MAVDKKGKQQLQDSVPENGENVVLQVQGTPASAERIPEYMKPWEEQRWKNILTKDEKKRKCSRCKEIGHICLHWPYTFCYLKVPRGSRRLTAVLIKGGPSKRRCGRCGRFGHNRRLCHGPIFF